MTLREAAELLHEAGIGLEVGYIGGGCSTLRPEDVEAWKADEIGFFAARDGVPREVAAEYERTHGGRLCSAYTKAGTPCRESATGYGTWSLKEYDPAAPRSRCRRHQPAAP